MFCCAKVWPLSWKFLLWEFLEVFLTGKWTGGNEGMCRIEHLSSESCLTSVPGTLMLCWLL